MDDDGFAEAEVEGMLVEEVSGIVVGKEEMGVEEEDGMDVDLRIAGPLAKEVGNISAKSWSDIWCEDAYKDDCVGCAEEEKAAE
mmetsp:Transcript_32652/g.47671  ORF Transcript_32652/g.47671 Transcript_32652/m.47671 type:complete len:84 (-) Transcript_32652:1196-1447(-)|eukprot:14076864-Ditylum_brightwellii.AAC.1